MGSPPMGFRRLPAASGGESDDPIHILLRFTVAAGGARAGSAISLETIEITYLFGAFRQASRHPPLPRSLEAGKMWANG